MDVIILSKSSKHHKYCVAGINLKTGDFVRLNSEDEMTHGALGNDDMICDDKSSCEVLDIVHIRIKEKKPLPTQPENVIVDQSYQWKKLGKCSVGELVKYLSYKSQSKVFGSNIYCLSEVQAFECNRSLELVRAKNIVLYFQQNAFGQKKSRVDFYINGLWHKAYYMTDPSYYTAKDRTVINDAILLISIPDGEPYFKFISKIFPITGA